MSAIKSARPNIIFILADDLGYADLSCYGRRDYETPVLDQLAADGIRFTDSYANAPVCSATRTALITGRYQYRLPIGLEEPLVKPDLGLSPDVPTIPSLLKKAGYQTALIGKWHLGLLPHSCPMKSGYDRFFGLRTGGSDYFHHAKNLWDGYTNPVERPGYLTDIVGDEAVATVKSFAAGDKPFFMSLHFNAPHWPWEGPNDKAEADRLQAKGGPRAIWHWDGGTLKTYAEMVTRMDDQIGRVLEAVRQAGIEDNTIIVFTSDNGGERFSDTWPHSGKKTELLEGGMRVPTILRWPAVAPKGMTSDQVVMTMDWLATFLAAAGGEADPEYPQDGIDLGDVIAGGPSTPRTVFWRYMSRSQEAVRDGDFKYLKILNNTFLFNVADDPLERANLKERMPEKYATLKQKYDDWNATMLPLNPDANVSGFIGSEMADHFGVQDRKMMV